MKEFIDEAEKIITQGRKKKLNEAIVHFAESISEKNEWRLDVFPNLAFNILNEYSRMKDEFSMKDNHSPVVVWHSRNLLELSFWILFCLQSEENERLLYEESSVDALDLLNQTKKAFAHDQSMLRIYEDGIAKLIDESSKRNINNIDRKFTNIGKIAASFELKQQFQFQNKFFSKYAHPTALQIISPHLYPLVKEQAFGLGCMNFVNAFHSLEIYFMNYATKDR